MHNMPSKFNSFTFLLPNLSSSLLILIKSVIFLDELSGIDIKFISLGGENIKIIYFKCQFLLRKN